jgi:TonB family protein
MRIYLLIFISAAMFAQTKGPQVRFKIEPEYTKQARKAKLQGLVAVSFTVDTQGNPKDIRVVRSLGKGLDEKAVEALKKWVFYPATKDGAPIDYKATVDFSFKLEKNALVRVRMEAPDK